MLDGLTADVEAMCERDPAATDAVTVALTYPGLHAIWGYRLAHACWMWEYHLLARCLSTIVRGLTGIEIHPAADLGRRVTIDHGMGVVIGETAVVGDDVHMYHGVTLGGNVNARVKRHPTVEDGVTIGAKATVIGDVTIGTGATVGAGSVVVDDVAPGDRVVGVPATSLS